MKISGLCLKVVLLVSTAVFVFGLTCKSDKPPLTPAAPAGPSYLLVNQLDTFSVSTTDPQGDSVRYVWDWGDAVKESTGYYASGATAREMHSWSDTGSYGVAVRAQNARGDTSGWSDNLTVRVGEVPGTPPAPTGPTAGSLSAPDTFTVTNGVSGRDSLRYLLDWGDGVQEWSATCRSGEPAQVSHAWSQAGAYDVRVRVKDKHDKLSEWSESSRILVGLFPCRTIATIPVGSEPEGVVVLPNGDYVYVSHYSGWVSVIRTSDNSIASTITLPGPLMGIDATRDGKYVYVAGYLGSVYAIRTSDDSVVATIPVGTYLWGLKVSPNGDHVYVTCYSIGDVAVIRTSDNTLTAMVRLSWEGAPGDEPKGLAVSPDGDYVYVADEQLAAVWFIRTADDSVVGKDQVGWWFGAGAVAFSPDGEYAYVTGALSGTQVAKIKTADRTYSYPISCIHAGGIAVLPSGEYIYVTRGNSISVIRAADDTVVADVSGWSNSYDVAVSPDGNRVYVVDAAANSCLSVLGY